MMKQLIRYLGKLPTLASQTGCGYILKYWNTYPITGNYSMGIRKVFSENRELLAIAICIIIFIGLVISYYCDHQTFKENKDKNFTLNFGGELIFSNDNIALTAENSNNSYKTIRISGIGNGLDTQMYTSLLVGETNENVISSDRIKLNNTNDLFVTTNSPVTEVNFSIEDIDIGSYKGWLVILNGNSVNYVPLSAATEVRVWQAIKVVLCGVVIAIGFWELIRLSSRTSLQGLKSRFKVSDFAFSPEMIKLVNLEKRYKSPTMATKIAVVDLSIILGVIISMLSLLSNGFVTSIVDIDEQTIAILFGMGLGIGSLNKLVDRT